MKRPLRHFGHSQCHEGHEDAPVKHAYVYGLKRKFLCRYCCCSLNRYCIFNPYESISHYLGLGHETMVCAGCRTMFLHIWGGTQWLTFKGGSENICSKIKYIFDAHDTIPSFRIKVCAGACWTSLLPPQLPHVAALAFEWAVKVAITAIGFSWISRSVSF